ncbi:hypothetical protein CONCODRAFT_69576 [Conidiobolus coronatus NRRL 28638]|uniref:RZ-type domain-containing protein n=1 Tax=Conidiobolus coronatus (strain ATCC 28846 / CBS 209.66 / NRRL 28638) TaxID=796925 RepID=A0A137P9V5_CONC2|nr:hypothetical protein CONCODRAFT_69576 [Conidiobolus coronatus NRRL 28638]|eukprot:KXN71787.1 hypothetical protein CONCODRAFT_69576 [Conidiobolus coronatus NRRL 28638]
MKKSTNQVTVIEDDDNWIDGTPITQEEINSIAKAIANDFKGSGHCYTCPNGHTYFIEACGTPMIISECFSCGEKIGGKEILVKNNAFNSEMDQLVNKYQEKRGEENNVEEVKRK